MNRVKKWVYGAVISWPSTIHWRNLIATALNVSFRLFASSFTPWLSLLTSLGVVAGSAVEARSCSRSCPNHRPPCWPFLCRLHQWRLSRCHHRPYPCCGPKLLNHVLNQALNLSLSRSPQASSGNWFRPAPKAPNPFSPRRPRQSLPRRSGPWPGSWFPRKTTPGRDVSGATRQPGRSNDGPDAGQGQQPALVFWFLRMRCFGLLLHWPEARSGRTRLTFPSSQLRSGPRCGAWLGASPSTATPTPTRA